MSNISKEGYRELYADLLPPGPAWTRLVDSQLQKLLLAWANEPYLLDIRANDLIREANPRFTIELLANREEEAGLPEECLQGISQTIEERRKFLLAKWSLHPGDATVARMISIALLIGYVVTIHEFKDDVFRVEQSTVETPLYGDDWMFVWKISASGGVTKFFRAGVSKAGDNLVKTNNIVLECFMNKYKPAHTILIFTYPIVSIDLGQLTLTGLNATV